MKARRQRKDHRPAHPSLVVTTDGKKRTMTLSALSATHQLDARVRSRIASLRPGEQVELRDDKGRRYTVARVGGGHAGSLRHGRIVRAVRATKRHRGKHRYETPQLQGSAVREIQHAYDEAKSEYHKLGEALFKSKSTTKG
ncbi:MAG: hypothetical protein JWM53_505 [bacterium]|nr:hypothetical protein [bacterium]